MDRGPGGGGQEVLYTTASPSFTGNQTVKMKIKAPPPYVKVWRGRHHHNCSNTSHVSIHMHTGCTYVGVEVGSTVLQVKAEF